MAYESKRLRDIGFESFNFLDGRDLRSLCVFHVVRTQNSVIIRLHIQGSKARTQLQTILVWCADFESCLVFTWMSVFLYGLFELLLPI